MLAMAKAIGYARKARWSPRPTSTACWCRRRS